MKFLSTTSIRISILLLGVIAIHHTISAQDDLGSPYSVFGPGLPMHRQTVAQAGMGGSGGAFFDPYRLNLINPAVQAYHFEPIFEFGGRGDITTYRTTERSFDANAFDINNISLSFPIKRNGWGLSVGLIPVTRVGYDVVANEYDEALDLTYRTAYNGSGGISQAYIGTGYKIFNQTDSAGNVTALALGGNMNYNFGNIENERLIYLPETPQSVGLAAREKILFNDVSFDFGAHFHTNIIKRTTSNGRFLKFMAGAVYGLGSSINSELTGVVTNFYPRENGNHVDRDTLSFSDGEKGKVTMPAKLTVSAGFDYVNNKRQRLRLALDYTMQEWSAFNVSFPNNSRNFDFENSQRYAAGLEFTPGISSLKLLERMEYRVGFKYEQTSLNLRDTEINDYGISFGLSVPFHFRRNTTQSTFNVSAEYGQYGTTDNGLIQEDYIRIYAGFTFTPNFRNKWFVQPKYD